MFRTEKIPFIQSRGTWPANPGKIVDINKKNTIGNHHGVYYYTLGQRKGINLSGMKVPYFVVEKDTANNILYVANDNENKWLMNSGCTVKSLNWINNTTLKNAITTSAKFRYRQSDVIVNINVINDDEIKVEFAEKIRAITPGQTTVFYDGDICLGGGVIDKIFR